MDAGSVARAYAYFSAESLRYVTALSQLRICFLAGTLGQGGAERQLFYSLRALRQCGAVPRVLCLAQNEFWEERIRNLGVPVTCVGQMQSKLKRLFRILVELRKQPPKIFQSQHFYTNAYVAAGARALRLCGIGALRCDGLSEVQESGLIGGWLSLHTPRVIVANSHSVRVGKWCSARSDPLPAERCGHDAFLSGKHAAGTRDDPIERRATGAAEAR